MRFDLVERLLEDEELLACERCPPIEKVELRHALTLVRLRLMPNALSCALHPETSQRGREAHPRLVIAAFKLREAGGEELCIRERNQ